MTFVMVTPGTYQLTVAWKDKDKKWQRSLHCDDVVAFNEDGEPMVVSADEGEGLVTASRCAAQWTRYAEGSEPNWALDPAPRRIPAAPGWVVEVWDEGEDGEPWHCVYPVLEWIYGDGDDTSKAVVINPRGRSRGTVQITCSTWRRRTLRPGWRRRRSWRASLAARPK